MNWLYASLGVAIAAFVMTWLRLRRSRRQADDFAREAGEMRETLAQQRTSHELDRAAMAEIVDMVGQGILAVSTKARVVVANRRVAEMFETSGDLAGRLVVEVIRQQSVVDAIDRALRGQPSSGRLSFDERRIEVRAFPVAASPEIAAVALFNDVTTIERLERVRRDFLDDFSHEVRTPLAGLKSAAETLERGGLAREQEQQLQHVMQRQIGRIERLVHDLADLNQIETGQLTLHRRNVHLREVLNELADDYRFALRGEDPVAFVDPARALQVFANLLDNAQKHGGGEIAVELAQDSGEAVVRVCDEGAGIPPADVERIFHRFYRVDRSRSQPGAGLGLAIAKHLVALHGGVIRAYNRAGGGATFEVRLPAADA